MKKVISVVIALVLCLSLAAPVFAADFVSSITGKESPEIVPVLDENGNPAIGVIHDENGNVIGYVNNDCLLITPVSKAKTSELIPDAAEEMLLSVYNQLVAGTMDLPYEKYGKDLKASNMVIRDLFDASWLCEGAPVDHSDILAPKGVTISITFKLGVDKNTEVYCMSYKHGEWNPIKKVVNNGDGTITCTFEDFCPVAFAVEKGSDTPPSQTGDDSNVSLWIGLMAISVVALGAVLILSRRKVAA